MSQKLSDKEIEQLKKLAQVDFSGDPEQFFQEYSDVEAFIVALGIKEGRDKVMGWKVYETYEKWSNNQPKLKPNVFAFFFKKNFKQMQESREGRYYRLDGTPFDLKPDDYLNRIAAENRKRREQALYEKKRQHGLNTYSKNLKAINEERRNEKKKRQRKERAARRAASECPPEE